MTSVWYVGRYGKRQLSVGDWAALGIITTTPNEWNLDNGWSIPESQFTPQQLTALSSLPGFAVNSPDGPRVFGIAANTHIATITDVIDSKTRLGSYPERQLVRPKQQNQTSRNGGITNE